MVKQRNLTERICLIVIGTALAIGVFSDKFGCNYSHGTKQSFQRGSGDIPNNELTISGDSVGVKTVDVYTKPARSYDGK